MSSQKLVRFDWAMKKLLRSKANFGILEGFLSELLKKDLKIIKILESESNKEDEDGKFNKADILVELANKELVLIEVQINSQFDYFHRMLFGTSKIVTEHLKEGEVYAKIKKVYSVNILYFDLGHGKDYVYHGTTSFIGMHEHDKLNLTEKQKQLYKTEAVHQIYPEYYLIKVNQFNDIAKDSLDEWIYFLKNEEIKNNFHAKGLSEAKQKLDAMKLTGKEREQYKVYIENMRYRESVTDSNYKAGEIVGIKKGEQIGIVKGEQIGIVKGEQIGAKKEKLAIAKTLKAAGMAIEQIRQITGLKDFS